MLPETKSTTKKPRRTEELSSVVVRFAGDSGDGIQVTGMQFTSESAIAGNDIATLPNFPAEIRAPAGSLAGVSAYQINFGSLDIHTPGDAPDVLVAFNPAALKVNIKDLKPGGTLIVNEDAFTEKNLSRVGYEENPVEHGELRTKYRVISIPIAKLSREALMGLDISAREIDRSKNFFALGVMLWMFNRPSEYTTRWIQEKFAKSPELVEANARALRAGITYAEATEIFDVSYIVKPALLPAGEYRNMSGTTALAYGLIAASQKSGLPLFLGAYPITPASDLLHELARHKHLDVITFQAEDEIAAICSAIGASFAGKLAVTSSSGPGISLKTEALGLAIITELPLVIINIQRGGPSTGLPTKTEQSDLLQALYGRSGEAPLCVLAASGPNDAFLMAYEACRIAVTYMTPVMLLSDGFITNTSEPWRIPNPQEFRPIDVSPPRLESGRFLPYLREESTLARQWAHPGTPGMTHRIGGLEKENKTGVVSYDGDNHQLMCELRREKIRRIEQEIPPLAINGDEQGDLLVVGWGGTEGAITEATSNVRAQGKKVSGIHLHHLCPLPPDLGKIISRFRRVLVPENNLGQLRLVLRERFLVDAQGLNLVNGVPMKVSDVEGAITQQLKQIQ